MISTKADQDHSTVNGLHTHEGNDYVSIGKDSHADYISTYAGDDYIDVHLGSVDYIRAGSGNDGVGVNGSEVKTITADDGDNRVYVVFGSSVKSIGTGNGVDSITILQSEVYQINSGDGGDNIYLSESNVTNLYSGDESNNAVSTDLTSSFFGYGIDHDDITITQNSNVAYLMTGSDFDDIKIQNHSHVHMLNSGNGHDDIEVSQHSSVSELYTSGGHDKVVVSHYSHIIHLDTSDGSLGDGLSDFQADHDDVQVMTGSHVDSLYTGAGYDKVYVMEDSFVDFLSTGAAKDNVVIAGDVGSLDLGGGNDVVHYIVGLGEEKHDHYSGGNQLGIDTLVLHMSETVFNQWATLQMLSEIEETLSSTSFFTQLTEGISIDLSGYGTDSNLFNLSIESIEDIRVNILQDDALLLEGDNQALLDLNSDISILPYNTLSELREQGQLQPIAPIPEATNTESISIGDIFEDHTDSFSNLLRTISSANTETTLTGRSISGPDLSSQDFGFNSQGFLPAYLQETSLLDVVY